jgi:hypothetical protein
VSNQSNPDPHFSRLWDGILEPGFLEGGKMQEGAHSSDSVPLVGSSGGG